MMKTVAMPSAEAASAPASFRGFVVMKILRISLRQAAAPGGSAATLRG
jgi:hypothetical protein